MSGPTSGPISGPALSPRSALELEDIDFSFAARVNGINVALYKDFSLRIEQGSIVTIMGASGTGKSTLGRIMAGIVIPQKGIVRRSPPFPGLPPAVGPGVRGPTSDERRFSLADGPRERALSVGETQVGKPRAPRPHLLPDDLVPAQRAVRCLSSAAFRRRVTALGAFPLPFLETETGDFG